MLNRFQLGITRRFLILYVLTAILPLLIIGALFFHTVNTKFNERIVNQLRTGSLLSKEITQEGLKKVELIASQASFLLVNEKYEYYLKTGQSDPLEKVLDRLLDSQRLTVMELINVQREMVANAGDIRDTSSASYQSMLRAALHGKHVSSIERLDIQGREEPLLTYLAMVPMTVEGDPRKIVGALVLGQSLRTSVSFQELTHSLPELSVRIFIKDKPLPKLTFSNIPQEDFRISSALLQALSKPGKPITETIKGKQYQSLAILLKNYRHEQVGYLVVSTPLTDTEELRRENSLYLGLTIFIGLLSVTLGGAWLKRSFINPMNHIAEASTKVVEEKRFDVHVPDQDLPPEIRNAVQNFNEMLKKLHENEQLRSTFLSALTHDLRTPLIAQSRVLEMLEEFQDDLDPDFKSLVRGLSSNNIHLLDMVNKLMESYQYEAGKITLELSRIDCRQLIEDTFHSIQPIALKKKQELISEIAPDCPMITGDFEQLKRVLINLGGNALENMPDGKWLKVIAHPADQNRVEIQVIDTGHGIPADILPHLFERYYPGFRRKQKIGSGLGLFITKMIIELHGGTIAVDSQVGRGTCFSILLPLEPFPVTEQYQP